MSYENEPEMEEFATAVAGKIAGALPDIGRIYGSQIDNGVRVKNARDGYSTVKAQAIHKNGKPATILRADAQQPEPICTFSEHERAIIGAWLLRTMKGHGIPCKYEEHHRALLMESAARHRWSSESEEGIAPERVRALLDDSISGADSVVPDFLSHQIISPSLLTAELMPECSIEDVPRGNTVTTPTMGHVSVTRGRAQGTPLSPVSASGLMDSLSTNIPNMEVALLVDNDLLQDANPVRVADQFLANCGEKFAEQIDKEIAIGVGGTTEILGLTQTTGVVDITPSVPTNGPIVLADILELLLAGVATQYRKRFGGFFISNSTNYYRVRGMQTGVSGDQTIVFGQNVESYNVFDRPWRIQDNIPNNTIIFAILSKFRLFRRLGLTVLREDRGQTLRLANQTLLMVRQRIGGRLLIPEAAAVLEGAPS